MKFVARLFTVLLGLYSLQAFADIDVTYDEESESVSDTLLLSGSRPQFDLSELGSYKLSAIATGLVGHQTNPMQGNSPTIADLSNGQLLIEKQSGPIQLFALIGAYSMPELGVPYTQAGSNTKNTWGYVPNAWIKLPVNHELSVSIGKLSAIGGIEGTYTYQNINIQRGLLWHQTSSVTRGIQADYENDRVSATVAFTDGSYSNTYNWLGAQVNLKINPSNEIGASWNGSLSANGLENNATPLLQNNSQISTLSYTYKSSHLTASSYLQYTNVPQRPAIGIMESSNTKGIGLLTTYRLFPLDSQGKPPKKNVSFPLRLEYIASSGNSYTSENNLLYGPNSSAWSITFTPTYQDGMYFARAEASYVQALNATPGTTFGASGTSNSQFRFLLEGGVLF